MPSDPADPIVFRLKGARTVVRDFVADDEPAFLTWAGHEQMYTYMAWRLDGPDAAAREFHRLLTHPSRSTPGRRHWYLAALNSDAAFIGIVGLDHYPDGRAEFGWYLSPEHWGQGYASDVTSTLLDFAFEHLSVPEVTATCDPANVASRRVLEKNGLLLIGEETTGTWAGPRPRLRLALSSADWKSRIS